MNFYKKLKIIMFNLGQEETTEQNEYTKEVVKKTYHYLISGTYTKIRNKDIILQNLELSPKELAQKTGLSDQAITKARYRIFKDIEKKLSPKYLYFLENRQWRLAANILYLAQSNNLSSNYLLADFIMGMKQSINSEDNTVQYFPLRECTKELKLLGIYSYQKVADLFSELDNQSLSKLIYLISLLDGKIESPLDRHQLLSYITKGNL